MKKYLMMAVVFAGIITVFSGCGTSAEQAKKNKVISLDYKALGVIEGNTVRFINYPPEIKEWVKEEYYSELMLPANYANVFGMASDMVGIVVGKEVQFYEYNKSTRQWEKEKTNSFILPQDYKEVFGLCSATRMLSVVQENTLYIYGYNDGKWIKFMNFDLPAGFTSVVSASNKIGVVTGNTVQFYDLDGDGLEEDKSMQFTLPEGYKGIIGYGRSSDISVGDMLGIVMKNEINFYTYYSK